MAERVSSPTFVGRQRELDRAAVALDRARDGRPAILLVAGEAGVGKTRFVHEVTGRAVESGARVLEGGCIQIGSDGLPFGPFIEALRGLAYELPENVLAGVLGTGRGELARLIPHLHVAGEEPPRAEVHDGSGQGRLFEYVLLLLERLASRAPLVLVIEDLHWADRSTLELLTFLVRNLRQGRIALVATYRTDELDRLHPFAQILTELERAGRAERIELDRFDHRELLIQVEGILGSKPDPGLVERIAARSGGNAFYAEELVAARDVGGRLPDTLRDVLLARIATLTEPTQEFVRVAAAGGARVSPTVLQKATGMRPAAIEAALRESVAAHVLDARDDSADDSYAFRHALVQEAVYGELLSSERVRLHAAFAEALIDGGSAETDALRAGELAYHLQAAGDEPRAFEAWIHAGSAAEEIYAFAEAGAHFERALVLWDRVPDAGVRAGVDRVELFTRAAAALEPTAPSRSIAHIRSALELVDPAAEPTRAGLLHARLGDYATLVDDGSGSLLAYQEAVRLVPAEPPSAARAAVLTELGRCAWAMTQWSEAVALCEEAVQIARAIGARKEESTALIPLGVLRVIRGDVVAGIGDIRRARDLSAELGDAFNVNRALTNLGGVLASAGHFDEAVTVAFEAADFAGRHGLSGRFGSTSLLTAASALFELGRWDDVADVLAREERLPGTHDDFVDRVRLMLDAVRGDFEDARPRADRQRARAKGPFYEGIRGPAALAELALWQGEPLAAREAMRSVVAALDGQSESYVIEPCVACTLGLRAEADLAAIARRQRSEARLQAALENGAAFLARMRACADDVANRRPYYLPRAQAWLAACEAEASRLEGHPDRDLWAHAAALWDAFRFPYRKAYALMREGEAALGDHHDRQRASRVLSEAPDRRPAPGRAPPQGDRFAGSSISYPRYGSPRRRPQHSRTRSAGARCGGPLEQRDR